MGSKQFFRGDEFENISKNLNISNDRILQILRRTFNYANFLYLLAEIFEEKNVASINKMFDILFENNIEIDVTKQKVIDFVNRDKSKYLPIEYFEKLNLLEFQDIVKNINSYSDDVDIQNRIHHAFLESIFTDLENIEENGFAISLAKEINKDLIEIVTTLEECGLILASRNIITILRQQREKIISESYSAGVLPDLTKYTETPFFEIGQRNKYWDTSEKLREIRETVCPENLIVYETTPKPERNPNYYFSDFEIKWLKHYFKQVRIAENMKGDCFSGKIKPYYDYFMKNEYHKLKEYVESKFGKNKEKLRNIIVTGIGGNEMLTHLLNNYAGNNINVYNITHPSKWGTFLKDNKTINESNTLIFANTRSGNTHETVITVEFLDTIFSKLNIVCICNSGKILGITKKHNGIDIEFPYGIAGRLSTFVTGVLLAPLLIINEDIAKELFLNAHNIDLKLSFKENSESYSYLAAQKMFIQAFVQGGHEDILLCGNSAETMMNHRHIIQTCMEGIKHSIKTVLTLGMPDTAHHQIEQLMKFVYSYYTWWIVDENPTKLHYQEQDLSKLKVNGRTINEDNIALSIAQLRVLMEQSPSSIVLSDNILKPSHQAFIYKHVENVMYYLARLFGDSPENNPIVKDTRDYASMYTKKFSEEHKTVKEHFSDLEKTIIL